MWEDFPKFSMLSGFGREASDRPASSSSPCNDETRCIGKVRRGSKCPRELRLLGATVRKGIRRTCSCIPTTGRHSLILRRISFAHGDFEGKVTVRGCQFLNEEESYPSGTGGDAVRMHAAEHAARDGVPALPWSKPRLEGTPAWLKML